MLNGYYGFEAGAISPYLGAGVGLARHATEYPAQTMHFDVGGGTHHVDLDAANENDSALAWQLMAGAAYALSPSTHLRLGYRYFRTGDVEFASVETTYAAHHVEAGVDFSLLSREMYDDRGQAHGQERNHRRRARRASAHRCCGATTTVRRRDAREQWRKCDPVVTPAPLGEAHRTHGDEPGGEPDAGPGASDPNG